MEFKKGIFGNNDEQHNDSGGNAAEITRLATELSEARQRIKELEAENAEMDKCFKELRELKSDATEWKIRAEKAEDENASLKTDIEKYKKQVNEMAAGISDRSKPLENLQEAYKTATAKANEIIRDAEALNRAAAEAKAAREQYDEITPKDVVKKALKYSFLGAFLFGCAYFGTVKGGMAEQIATIKDYVSRIAYNQYFAPWGIDPIPPFTDNVTATKIWNATYHNWISNQTQQQAEE